MWRAAEDTAGDLMARLAVVPMVLEARGLDVSRRDDRGLPQGHHRPRGRRRCRSMAVAAMEVIYAEEVHHVAYGSKWFHFLCGREDRDPKPAFHDMVQRISTAR
jgi:uncharacterized ferritin-like protein (DUF455 family)